MNFRSLQSCLLCVVLTLASSAVSAQEAQMPAVAPLADYSSNLVSVVINLGIVVLIIVLFAWIFRRAQGFSQPASGSLQVIATLPLGPKERMLLVQVGAEQFVVGASASALTTLHVLETPVEAKSFATEHAPSFKKNLQNALSKVKS